MLDSDDGAFDAVMALLDHPMFVVTTSSEEERAGCLVGFASQVSIAPSRFLVGLSKKNHTFRIACAADYVAVHLIPSDHRELAELFGEQTGDRVDKFDRCVWTRGPHDVPILGEAAAWFCGEILERLDVGDHVAFLLAPRFGHAPDELGGVVTFADVRDFDAGHDA